MLYPDLYLIWAKHFKLLTVEFTNNVQLMREKYCHPRPAGI